MATTPSYDKIVGMLQDFIDGKDRSKEFVGQIETLLITEHVDTPLYEALSVPLASYTPGGGEHLYSEEELAKEFRVAIDSLPHTATDTDALTVAQSILDTYHQDFQNLAQR